MEVVHLGRDKSLDCPLWLLFMPLKQEGRCASCYCWVQLYTPYFTSTDSDVEESVLLLSGLKVLGFKSAFLDTTPEMDLGCFVTAWFRWKSTCSACSLHGCELGYGLYIFFLQFLARVEMLLSKIFLSYYTTPFMNYLRKRVGFFCCCFFVCTNWCNPLCWLPQF